MAHNHTVMGQILKLVSRHEFEREARRHHKGQKLRKIDAVGAVCGDGDGTVVRAMQLRDIVANMKAQAHKQYHLGVRGVTRSSLARVNEEQPYGLYEGLFGRLLVRCQGLAPGHGFRFKNKLYSLDATTIDLCLSVFPWAKFRRTKGAIKLHVGLDHEGYLHVRERHRRQDRGHPGGADVGSPEREHRRGRPALTWTSDGSSS